MSKQSFTTGQVLTAAQVNSLQANDFNQTVSVKTANYTLAAADKGTRIEFNTSGSVTCTVNSGLFDAGDTLVIQNRGAGTATITAGTATVNTSASLALSQYSAGTIYFVSDSAALFFGDAAGISASIVDAKGDLIVGTADNTVARLAVGTDGHTLVADSGAATGLAYSAGIPVVLNAQTATYTVVLADAYKLVTMSVASANDFQIPTNANVAFPTGTVINVIQIGAGQTTIKAVTSGTTTISSTGATATTPKLRAQFSAASCIKVATDTWYVVGDIA